jgi:hypothetical protein
MPSEFDVIESLGETGERRLRLPRPGIAEFAEIDADQRAGATGY